MGELTVVQLGRGIKCKSISQTTATAYKKCFICQEENSKPLYSLTTRGYGSLLFAVQNRDDDIARRHHPHVKTYFLKRHQNTILIVAVNILTKSLSNRENVRSLNNMTLVRIFREE